MAIYFFGGFFRVGKFLSPVVDWPASVLACFISILSKKGHFNVTKDAIKALRMQLFLPFLSGLCAY